MFEATIPIGDSEQLVSLLGTRDQHLRTISKSIPVGISTRDGQIHIEGEEHAVLQATEVIEQLKTSLGHNGLLEPELVTETISRVIGDAPPVQSTSVEVRGLAKKVRAQTPGQSRYLKAIRQHNLVFCIGPAGTGKTYLAVAAAVEALQQESIRKIVLVRPAVEAGESLGFLPGDLYAKINPYLRPLLDALRDMLDYDQVRQQMEDDVIEVIPLAYMRGRTLNDAFIILDEAQNTTVGQMKMFLTRMGMGSKVVVSGDATQIDLPPHTKSGLTDAVTRLRNIEGFAHVTLRDEDIVRHRLVQEIVRAYEEKSRKKR